MYKQAFIHPQRMVLVRLVVQILKIIAIVHSSCTFPSSLNLLEKNLQKIIKLESLDSFVLSLWWSEFSILIIIAIFLFCLVDFTINTTYIGTFHIYEHKTLTPIYMFLLILVLQLFMCLFP